MSRPLPHHRSAIDVQVLLGGDLDVEDWQRRHASGDVPDAFPYGLDRLSGHGLRVRGTRLRSQPPAKLRGVVRRLGGGLDWTYGAVVQADADAVLAWDERVGVPTVLMKRNPPPVVGNVIWSTDAVPPRPLRDAVAKGLRRMHSVFVLSAGQVPVLREAYGVDPRRTVVVPFGIDGDFFTPGDQADVDPDLVVSVGNDRDRDFPSVLRAFRSVREARPTARLVIVSKSVQERDLGSVSGVTLVPHLSHSELRDLVRRAAVTVTLTRPNLHVSGITAVLETIAMGRPAITTSTPGMGDYVHDGGGIVTVPPGDHAETARVCTELLADPDRASELGVAGRARLEEQFTTERQAERLAPLLRGAAAAG